MIFDGNVIRNSSLAHAIWGYQANSGRISNNLIYNTTTSYDYIQAWRCNNTVIENNTIVGNLLVNNLAAVSITDSDNNNIIENTMMDNENGVFLFSSYNNSVYGNSFINNTHQVYDNVWLNPWLPQLLSVNFWDNSTIGNYWSDYNGTDTYGDGIGDTPYIINEENQDNYPLVEPTIIPEFPSWAILPIVLVITLFSVVVKRKLYALKQS